MTDIARLGMAIDSSGLVQARKEAKRLAEEAVVTDKRIKELTDGTKNLTRENTTLSKGLTNLKSTVVKLEQSLKQEKQTVANLISAEAKLESENKQLAASSDRVAKSIGNTKNQLAGAAAAMIGVGSFGAAVSSSTKLLSDFEFALARVGVVSGASSTDMVALEKEIRMLGATTIHSASAAADAARSLAQSGFTVDQIIGALRPTLELATSAMVDTGQAAEITGKIMNTFKISADEAGQITDKLAKVANSSQADIVALADGFRYSGGAGKSFNVTVAELAAALGVLNTAGQDNTTAGTGLRRALIDLATSGDKAVEIFGRYGIKMEELSPATHSLIQIVKRLNDAGVTTVDIYKAMDVRGAESLGNLVRGYDQLVSLTDKANAAQGTGAQINAALNDTLTGSFKGLLSVTEELVLQQTGWKDSLRDTSDAITNILRVFAGYESTIDSGRESAEEWAAILETLGKVAIPLMAGKMVSMLIPAISSSTLGFRAAVTQMQLMTGASYASATAITGLAGAASRLNGLFMALGGPTGAVIASVTALGFLITKETAAEKAASDHAVTLAKIRGEYDKTTKAVDEQSTAFKNLTKFKNLEALRNTEEDIANVTKELGKSFEQTRNSALGFSSDSLRIGLVFGDVFKEFKNGAISITEFNAKIRDVGISTGNLKEARRILDMSEPLEASTIDAKRLKDEIEGIKKVVTTTPTTPAIVSSVEPNEEEEKRKKEFDKRLKTIIESLKTEKELEDDLHAQNLKDLITFKKSSLKNEEEGNRLIELENKRHADKIIEINDALGKKNKDRLKEIKDRVDAVRDGLRDEEQVEIDAHVKRFNAIAEAEAENLISKREAREIAFQEQAQHEQRIVDIRKENEDTTNRFLSESQSKNLTNAASFFGNMAEIAAAGGEKSFQTYKRLAQAQAAISATLSFLAVLGDASIPTPLRIPLAASIAGVAAVQVAQIEQQEYSGRALGGQVRPGTSYLVGERGPELLTMGNKSGNITPNNKMGSGSINNTNVFQISAGVEGTVRSEIMRIAPLIAAQAQAGVESAMYKGGSMSRAAGRRR